MKKKGVSYLVSALMQLCFACFFLLRFCPYPLLYYSGKALGWCFFRCIPRVRKRILSNLALATNLHLKEKALWRYGIESAQNIILLILEMGYAAKSRRNQKKLIRCENPSYLKPFKKKRAIILGAHQANWELVCMDIFYKRSAVAVGKEMKSETLTSSITKMRERFGLTIVPPKNAVRACTKALRQDKWVGLLGDQSRTDSRLAFPFFGRRAYTSGLAASLAYNTNSPIIIIAMRRKGKKQSYRYVYTITPDTNRPKRDEVARMTMLSMMVVERSIRKHPGQWFWLHNRWKQPLSHPIKKRFRHESILIILPQKEGFCRRLAPLLPFFRKIYPFHFITVFVPDKFEGPIPLFRSEIVTYANEKEVLVRDYRFKLVFDFSTIAGVKAHFSALSAFTVVSFDQMKKIKTLADEQRFCRHFTKNLLAIIEERKK